MNNILICGTIHDDFRGPERLARVIREYKPTAIAVESQSSTKESLIRLHTRGGRLCQIPILGELAALYYFRRNNPKLKPNPETATKYIESYGFESWFSEEHARRNNLPLFNLEDGLVLPPEKNNFWPLVNLPPTKFQESADNYYNREQQHNERRETRDEYMAPRVLDISKEQEKLLIVIGNAHAYGHNCLYDLVSQAQTQDLNVKRMKLIEADKPNFCLGKTW